MSNFYLIHHWQDWVCQKYVKLFKIWLFSVSKVIYSWEVSKVRYICEICKISHVMPLKNIFINDERNNLSNQYQCESAYMVPSISAFFMTICWWTTFRCSILNLFHSITAEQLYLCLHSPVSQKRSPCSVCVQAVHFYKLNSLYYECCKMYTCQ